MVINQIGVTVFLLYPIPKFLKVPSVLKIMGGFDNITNINKNIKTTTEDNTKFDLINCFIIY